MERASLLGEGAAGGPPGGVGGSYYAAGGAVAMAAPPPAPALGAPYNPGMVLGFGTRQPNEAMALLTSLAGEKAAHRFEVLRQRLFCISLFALVWTCITLGCTFTFVSNSLVMASASMAVMHMGRLPAAAEAHFPSTHIYTCCCRINQLPALLISAVVFSAVEAMAYTGPAAVFTYQYLEGNHYRPSQYSYSTDDDGAVYVSVIFLCSIGVGFIDLALASFMLRWAREMRAIRHTVLASNPNIMAAITPMVPYYAPASAAMPYAGVSPYGAPGAASPWVGYAAPAGASFQSPVAPPAYYAPHAAPVAPAYASAPPASAGGGGGAYGKGEDPAM